MNKKKVFKSTLYIILVIFITACFAVFYKYHTIENTDPDAVLQKVTTSPKNEAELGERIKVDISLKTPWHVEPVKAEVFTPKGTQLIKEPKIEWEDTHWGFITWKIDFSFQPYKNGIVKGGKIVIKMTPPGEDGKREITARIPRMRIKPLSQLTGTNLEYASAISKKETGKDHYNYTLYLIIIGAIILLIVLYYVYRKRKQEESESMTLWSQVILGLGEIKDRISKGDYDVEYCISELTDIIRDYLEKRFEIHAPRQTTEEFMREMESRKSPLSNQDRNFLKEFLASSDMVKFAKYKVSKEDLENTIKRAEELVNKTAPEEEKNSEKE